MSLRGQVTVVGVAESDLGEVGPGFTPLDLIGQATLRALEDVGLGKSDVDGLFSASAYYHMPTLSVGEYLGIRPRYSDATSLGGSSFVSHLFHAAAIEAGLCEVALITYGSTQRSGGGRLVTGSARKGRVGPSSRGVGSHPEGSSPSTPAGAVSRTTTLACTGCS